MTVTGKSYHNRDVARKFWRDIGDECTALFYLVGTRM